MSSPLSGASSPLSSLSSVPDDEPMPPFMLDKKNGDHDDASSSEVEAEDSKYGREASPPHADTLADNPDIAFITMFRARFGEAFSQKLIHFGPQDIERGVCDSTPSPQVEQLLCALLALVLNRKKPIENNHHGRALEEAIQNNKTQWPYTWEGRNPLSGGQTFEGMTPARRLDLMRALILWALHESEVISNIIKDAYKGTRQADDLNVPLSVQPWGKDELKRRYWLVEGRDDTDFRLYRENNPVLKNGTWRSMAGTIDELRVVVEKLQKDKAQASRRLAQRITMAIPRFEASEEKRRRREYRMARKAAFTKPDPGFSMYEGRTRGKRMRYTYDEGNEDEDDSEAPIGRRSTRNSGVATPADDRPITTLSGRQIRSRVGGVYGESILSKQNTDRGTSATDASDEPTRPTRSGRAGVTEATVDFGETSSEGEWDGGDENEPDEPDEVMDDLDDEEASAGAESDREGDRSLVVTLRYGQRRSPSLQLTSASPNTSKPSDEVVVPRPSPLSTMQTVTPQSSAPNGHPTPAPTINGTNGSLQPAPRAFVSQTTAVLPPLSSVLPKKQAQLSFQPTPQHILKPILHQQPPQPISQHQLPK